MAQEDELHFEVEGGRHVLNGILRTSGAVMAGEVAGEPVRWRGRVGATTFTPAATRRTVRLLRGEAEEIVAELEPGFVSEVCASGTPPTWRHASGELRPRLWAVLRQYASPLATESPDARELMDRMLARTLAHTFGGVRFRSDDAWLPPAALIRVARASQAAGGRLNVAQLAHGSGLSHSAFSRAFRGSTGITPGDWLIGQRLKVARRLLTGTDLPIAIVADTAGLAGAAHLTQLFRKRFDTTPASLRRSARGAGVGGEGDPQS